MLRFTIGNEVGSDIPSRRLDVSPRFTSSISSTPSARCTVSCLNSSIHGLPRDTPAVRPDFEWQVAGGSVMMDTLRPADEPGVLALIQKHEGPESAHLAAHWIKRQPKGILVAREADVEETAMPAGVVIMVALHQINADDAQVDPAVGKAWEYVQRHAPLRPGEVATFFRFWMARDTYQAVSPVQSLLFVTIVRHYLATPGLVYTIFPCSQPDFWMGVLTYADLQRVPQLDFRVSNEDYGIFGHNWRTVPPLAWLALLGEREIANAIVCLLYTSPSPRDRTRSRMPSSA